MTTARKTLTKTVAAALLALTLLGSVASLAFSGDPSHETDRGLPKTALKWENLRVP